MKAAVYQGVDDVKVMDLPDPKPGPKDVVVKVVASGICGTDVTEYNVMNMGSIQPGREFGHEFAGTVAEVGGEVKGIREGMRVTVKPITAHRGGTMEACMIGGFSQYSLIEDAALGYNVFPLPDKLSFDDGAWVEPFSVGMHGVNLAETKPKDKVLILGAGPIGMGALAGVKALGVEDIVVSDISDFRLQKAKALGASLLHNPNKDPLVEFLVNAYGEPEPFGGIVDVVIDAAGVGQAMQDALDAMNFGARYSIIALHKHSIDFDPFMVMMKYLVIRGSQAYTDEFDQVMGFMANGKANLKPLITHRYPLADINAALKMASKVTEAVKVIVDMPV
jgi:2-desacetyl-2-hydroxyethyl bacteriochlorophyllide A dehydrogenase